MVSTVQSLFLGCCSSAFLMEILMTLAPHSANLVTFLQFFFIALQGYIFTTKFGKVKRKIPLRQYVLLVILFFFTSVANNFVYSLHVSTTLHMIIRSASSPASMLVAWYIRKVIPKTNIVIGSLLITIGAILATYGGASIVEQTKGSLFYWSIGVGILLGSLFTGAFTGVQQEMLYKKYGKHPDEMMFYTHALPLPTFLGIYPELSKTISTLDHTLWFLIAVNIMSQFYCAHSVHKLATKETSVTVNFILTLRKFGSLLISSIVFKNNLTYLHVLGTFFVVVGTCVYFNLFERTRQQPVAYQKKPVL